MDLEGTRLTNGSVTVSRVVINYDARRAENITVEPDDVLVDGKPALQFAIQSLLSHGNPIGPSAAADLELVLPSAWEACSLLETKLPGELVFRDAADRVHEVMPGYLWKTLTDSGFDQEAFQFAARFISNAYAWEAANQASAFRIHKGTLMFYGAASSFLLRNVDRGLLFLEAGEASDREVYARIGDPGGEVDRPGALTLLLDPNPTNAFARDVHVLRAAIDAKLADFARTGGEPPRDPLDMSNFDGLLLKDPNSRAAAKLTFASLVWRLFNFDDPAVAPLPREGEVTRRRHAELLLDLLTASEVILRDVDGSNSPREHLVNVVGRLYAHDWTTSTPSKIVEELKKVESTHADDIGKCLDNWIQANLQAVPGAPWYAAWIEQGRYVRNRIAHKLETTGAVTTRWSEVDRVAWFSLFAALWLKRRKNPGPKFPPGPAPAMQLSQVPFSTTPGSVYPLSVVQPSGIFGPLSPIMGRHPNPLGSTSSQGSDSA
jgi:hypothetical protein